MLQHSILNEEVLLLNEILNYFNSFPATTHTNKKGITQASVCMIFRFNPKLFEKDKVLAPPDNKISVTPSGFLQFVTKNSDINTLKGISTGIELFFIKRAINPKDHHSGEVAFPGGKCDGTEPDFQTAIREAQEECGIDLKNQQKYAYLGKFPKNFYAYTTPKGRMFVTVHMFFQLDLTDTPMNVNPGEIQSFFWLPLRFFLDPDLQTFRNTEPVKIDISTRLPKGKLMTTLVETMSHGLTAGTYMHFDLPNNSSLWGLTYFFMIYFLYAVKTAIKMSSHDFKSINKQALDYILENGLKFNFIYNYRPLLGLRSSAIDFLYYMHRVEQFEGRVDTPTYPYALFGIFFIAVPLLLNYHPKL